MKLTLRHTVITGSAALVGAVLALGMTSARHPAGDVAVLTGDEMASVFGDAGSCRYTTTCQMRRKAGSQCEYCDWSAQLSICCDCPGEVVKNCLYTTQNSACHNRNRYTATLFGDAGTCGSCTSNYTFIGAGSCVGPQQATGNDCGENFCAG